MAVITNIDSFARRVRMPEPRRKRCSFSMDDSVLYQYVDDVIWIQARTQGSNYSVVFATRRTFTVSEGLAALEARLAQFGFFRVQRSSLINLEHVVEIRRERRGRYAIVMSDGATVIVQPSVKEQVEKMLFGSLNEES